MQRADPTDTPRSTSRAWISTKVMSPCSATNSQMKPPCVDPAGMPVSSARHGDGLAMLKGKVAPADRARRADTKAIGRRAATQLTIIRGDDAVPKVL